MQNEPRLAIRIINCKLLIVNILYLLPDAEGREDEVEDVVGGGLAGEGVEGPEGAIEVEQDHLVGDAGVVCEAAVFESGARDDDGLLLAEVGEEAGFGGSSASG